MTPYEVLRVGPNATDEEIRKAYLDLVRQFPPERAPDQFRQVSAAYEAVKDEKSRLKLYVFDTHTPLANPFEAVTHHFRRGGARPAPNLDALMASLRKAATR